MSDYGGNSTLEDWLAREVFFVEEVHPEIVKRFEEWREGIENDIERWMESDDGNGNPLSWRGWGRGFSSISDEDMLRFESLVEQSVLQLVKGDIKTSSVEHVENNTVDNANEISNLDLIIVPPPTFTFVDYGKPITSFLNSWIDIINIEPTTKFPAPKEENKPIIPFNEIRRLQEVEKQYRNYRNTIREMLNNGELVYKKIKSQPWDENDFSYNVDKNLKKEEK